MKKYLILNRKHLSKKERSGFTMIELMVVLSIMIILSVSSFAVFGNAASSKSVKAALDEMESLLTAARKKSITQDNGARWGVHVENTTSSNRLVMFSGATYASGTPSNFYSMKRNVVLTNPVSSSTYDVLFDPITGYLSEKKVLTIATLKKDGIIGDIVLNTIGSITKRYDYGLVGYWHFDEGTGTTAYDASGIGNAGTLVNSPTWQVGANCRAGYCLGFNGSTNYINGGTSSSFDLSTFTISLWWNGINSVYYGGPFNNRLSGKNGFQFVNDISSTSVFTPHLVIWNGTSEIAQFKSPTSYNMPFSGFKNFVWTYDGSSAKFFVDGVQQTVLVSGVSNYPLTGVFVGRGFNYVGGMIDEVRVYNRALSASEVLGMYNDLK